MHLMIISLVISLVSYIDGMCLLTIPLEDTIDDVNCDVRYGRTGFIPSRSDCSVFYICSEGTAFRFQCAQGTLWNSRINGCDWPKYADDCRGSSNSSVEPTPPSPNPTEANPTQSTDVTENTSPNPTDTTKSSPTRSTDVTQYTGGWTEPTKSTTESPYTFSPFTPDTNHTEEYVMVCYFTNWAWYRQGPGKFLPENVDPYLCTHINYGFATLDYENLVPKIYDSWADLDNHFYERVIKLKSKNPLLKILLSLGGWNDSAGDKYSRLVTDPSHRRRFVTAAIEIVNKFGFDGLDLDWEYPGCWQGDCDHSRHTDKENYVLLLEELRTAFDAQTPRLLLTAAVSAGKATIDTAYDVPLVSKYLDLINVMSYDLHGSWDKQTGTNAPMYYRPGDFIPEFNVNYSINYWLHKGADPKKLIVGVPLYGRSFTLADANNHGINALTNGPGEAGRDTGAGGFLAFYEICRYVKRGGWTKEVDEFAGPYAYKGNQWVGYDDIPAVTNKAKFIKKLGLGGAMVWSLDLDDFRGECCKETNPLLKTLAKELRGFPAPNEMGCE